MVELRLHVWELWLIGGFALLGVIFFCAVVVVAHERIGRR